MTKAICRAVVTKIKEECSHMILDVAFCEDLVD